MPELLELLRFLAFVAFFGALAHGPTYLARRRFRNSRDPSFQGDGWRWSLSFELAPFRLDWLPLTREQRDACRHERAYFLKLQERLIGKDGQP